MTDNIFPRRIIENASAGYIMFLGPDDPQPVPWTEMLADASGYAKILADDYGVGHGSKVALLGATGREIVTGIEATWLAGAAVAVMPLPFRFDSIDEFVAVTSRRVRLADIDVVLVDDLAGGFLVDFNPGVPVVQLSELAAKAAANGPVDPPEVQVQDDDIAILQFTSGSTAEPKAVNVTFEVLETNLRAVNELLNVRADMPVVSWLPLYHDMGLVGILASAMSRAVRLHLAGPQDYMSQPGRWMRWISEYKAELTAGPNSAYAISARFLRRAKEPLDLSSLRAAINGAEPVSVESMNEWVEAGAPHGLSPGCVFPAFGMAEVGIAVTFPPEGRGLATETIDEAKFTNEHVAVLATNGAPSRPAVMLGKPVEGVELMIGDPATGFRLPTRHVGEMLLRGPSVTPGYYRNPDANSVAFRDGWFRTGDLAYVTETGELVCCGRIKDLIIMGGRNIYPQDIEASASKVDGVRAGNTAAFGLLGDDGTEHTIVVVESRKQDSGQMRRAIKVKVATDCGVTPKTVVVVSPGTLPKTSSGKIQRSACKSAYEAGDYKPVLIG